MLSLWAYMLYSLNFIEHDWHLNYGQNYSDAYSTYTISTFIIERIVELFQRTKMHTEEEEVDQ